MYRAGSAFISVSPSFRGFQTKAAVEARKLRPIKIPVEYDHRKLVVGQPKAIKVGVDADTTAANGKLAGVEAQGRRVGGMRPTVRVDADTTSAHSKLTALQARLGAMAAGRTLLQVGVVAAPMAIPAAAGLAAGGAALGGIATAVGVGAGLAGILGLTQLTKAREAQKALTEATDERTAALGDVEAAERSVADATAAAAASSLASTRAVADAQRALADARRNVGRVERAAEAQVAAAQDRLEDTQDRVTRSLEALHDARQQALRDLADLQARTRANALETEAADLALIEARERLTDAEANVFTSATDMRAARLEVAEAEQRVSNARRQAQRDAEDLAKAEREGIDASDPMTAAREQLAQAREDRAQARIALADAERSAAEARADAARAVADAERNLARARVDAAAAEEASAQRVADAKAQLAEAKAGLTAADQAQAAAQAKLTRGQRRMLAGLASLQAAWAGFLDLVDRPLAGFMVAGMEALEKALPGLAAFLKPVLRSLRGVMDLFGDAAASRGARRFASDFGEFAAVILKDAGRGTRNLVAGFGNLLRAFMPLSTDMSKGLVGLTRGFRRWTAGLEESNGFQRFIDYARTEGPKLLRMFKALGGMLIAIGIALAPVASRLVELVTGFAQWTANLAENHPWIIRVVAVLALVGAGFGLVMKAVAGVLVPLLRFVGFVISVIKWVRIVVFNLRFLWFVLRANPVGMVITIVMLLVGAFKIAYARSETFRKIVDKAWSGIQSAVSGAWNKVIKPVFRAMGDFITKTLPNAFRSGIDGIGRIWNSLQRLAAKPVNFLIGTVYNNGIRKLIGALPGVDTPDPLPLVSWGTEPYRGPKTGGPVSGGVQEFAAGGVLPGWSPGRDIHRFYSATGGRLDLSGGEAIMRPEWTRMVGRQTVDFLNGAARRGRRALVNAIAAVSGRALHERHAAGGVYAGRRLKYFLGGVMPLAGGVLTGVHPLPYYGTGATFAGDINSPGDLAQPPSLVKAWKNGTVAQRISRTDSYGNHYLVNHSGQTSLYAHLSSFIAGVGQQVRAGQALGRVGATGNANGAHLHFEVRGGNVPGGVDTGTSSGGGKRKHWWEKFGDAIRAVKDFAASVGGWFTDLLNMGGWGGLIKNMATSTLGGLREWVNDKIPGPGPFPKIFDQGGQLHRGYTLAYHGARKPDKVLTDAQWRDIHTAATAAASRAGVFHLYDSDGRLMGTLRGAAERVVASQASWDADQTAAGMGGRP